jgi:hypothetical protein
LPWGAGFGTPFGGGAFVPLTNPRSEVGQAPVVLDFTTEPDGPFPGAWSFFVLSDDGAGNKTSTPEPTPLPFFRTRAGRGLWNYQRSPVLPPVGVAYDEHGLIASVAGVINGSQAELAIAFDPPPTLLDARQDEFAFEALLGFRASLDLTTYIGGRVRAHWNSATGWDTPIVLETVQAVKKVPTAISTAIFPVYNDPEDAWLGGKLAELRVNVRNGLLTATFNGVVSTEAAIDDGLGGVPVILVRAWNRRGLLITAVPCVAGLSFQTLRDLERLGPPPQIIGEQSLITPQISPVLMLSIPDLMDKGFLKRTGPRVFVFTQDVQANIRGTETLFNEGDQVITIEPFTGQETCGVIRDLAAIRNARGGLGR